MAHQAVSRDPPQFRIAGDGVRAQTRRKGRIAVRFAIIGPAERKLRLVGALAERDAARCRTGWKVRVIVGEVARAAVFLEELINPVQRPPGTSAVDIDGVLSGADAQAFLS